ncbi:MAG: PKD domain-containing protein [Candidatus Bipolaricaulota bacterium]
MRWTTSIALVFVVLWAGLGQPGGLPPGIAARVEDLERVLSDWRLGCGACPARLGWDEEQLALFVAGRLTFLGFPADLARDGSEWWVLVRVQADGAEVSLPVLPGLPPLDREGRYQPGVFLGRIPWTGPGRFDPRYLDPEGTVPFPGNILPRVALRHHPLSPRPGEAVWFIADVSDADGMVIEYRWDFGDGEGSAWPSPDHVFAHDGVYTVILTVLDDRGGTVTASVTVGVSTPQESGGCGCGR